MTLVYKRPSETGIPKIGHFRFNNLSTAPKWEFLSTYAADSMTNSKKPTRRIVHEHLTIADIASEHGIVGVPSLASYFECG